MPICSFCWNDGECNGYCKGELPITTSLGPQYWEWRVSEHGELAARALRFLGHNEENRARIESVFWGMYQDKEADNA